MEFTRFLTFLAVILIICIKISNTETLGFVLDTYDILNDAFDMMIENFNNYANETNLDITLRKVSLVTINGQDGYNDYDSTLTFLTRKNNKYDLFAYDINYLKIFSPYLLDLNEFFPKDHLDLYSSENNKRITFYNNKRLGLPLLIFFSVLFSNETYLKKYGKESPKTWDELIETAEYIIKEEKDKYNNEIIGYNGLFPGNENSMCSIYQFLYSYRETKESPIPEFSSQTSIDALNKLLEIRERISSNDIFKSSEDYIVSQMIEGKLLFSNFYNSMVIPNYKMYPLPGKNEGVNGSIVGGYGLGINKNIDMKKIKAAVEVIKYFTSEKFQKEVILNQLMMFSALTKIYDDEEYCQNFDCNIVKNSQFFFRPSKTMENYSDFSKKATEYFQQFLDGQISIKEVLTNIENITKIFYFKVNSTLGAIILAIIIILFVAIALSLIMLFIPKYKKEYFKFLPTDLWMMYAFGSVFMLVSNIEYYNEKNIMKCTISNNFKIFGNAFIFIPILYKLLVSFPKKNTFSDWLRKNRFIYIVIFMVIYSGLSVIISSVGTFKVTKINFKNNNFNFQICNYDNYVGKIFYIIQNHLNILLYFVICFLIFLEWNLIEICFDLRHITFIMIIDGITIVLNIILNTMNINDYVLYNLIPICINLLFVFWNHIYLFILRVVFLILFKGKINEEEMMNNIIKKIYVGAGESIESSNIQIKSNISKISKTSEMSTSSRRLKIISYHYSTFPTE